MTPFLQSANPSVLSTNRAPFAEGQSLNLATEAVALGAPGGMDFVERSKGRRPCVGADEFDAGVTHARVLP